MKIYFEKLLVVCKKKIEEIDLTHQVSFFHGKIGSGKSTIARLLDFCFGGDLENTSAINSEFIAAKLILVIGLYQVVLERVKKETTILIVWKLNEEVYRLNAPITGDGAVIYNEDIYSFSDVIFHLLDMAPLKIAKNKSVNSPMERLSIRNFFWYAYLKQEKLDNTFFRFEEPFHAKNSKEVLKFVLGYFTEKLNEYEIEISKIRDEKRIKQSMIDELNSFLKRFDYSLESIESQLELTKKELFAYETEKNIYQNKYLEETHSSDRTRIKLLKLIDRIDSLNIQNEELKKKIELQKSLKSELISSSFKIDRASSANKIFTGLPFNICPCCGEGIEKNQNDKSCMLCKEPIIENQFNEVEKFQMIKIDVDHRIKDIENSIFIHEAELIKSKKEIDKIVFQRNELNKILNDELRVYESAHLSNTREIENKISQLRERVRNLLKQSALPKEIDKIQLVIDAFHEREIILNEKIIKEREKLNSSDHHLSELESVFAETLNQVGMPGFKIKTDTVSINRRNWAVKIISKENTSYSYDWGFDDAGSGGKKTLFNVCFLLAIHIVAEKNNLPLPTFMIIDTPMKNIDQYVNEELFKNFYRYLYSLVNSSLSKTRIIIIDNAIIKPTTEENVDFSSRYLTPDEDENPPLISYYRGA